MEMMHMMMMDLDEQIPLPFQDLSSPPLMEFSSGISSTTSNHPSPQVIYGRYPPPPLIMQYSSAPQLRRSAGGWPPFHHQGQLKPGSSSSSAESVEAMREMIFRMAALQPVQIDPESIKPPKRRNVKISKDPQSVAARHRRERISERIRILQRLVPGGTKMDTASMLDEAAHYMKFLKKQVQSLEQAATGGTKTSPPVTTSNSSSMMMNNNNNHHGDGSGSTNNNNLIRACGLPPQASHHHVLELGSICGDA